MREIRRTHYRMLRDQAETEEAKAQYFLQRIRGLLDGMAVRCTKDLRVMPGLSYVQTKLVDTEAGVFDGWGAAFSSVDRQGDRILPGAFKKTIRENEGRVPLLWQHQWDAPIGVAGDLAEDNYGLKFRGRVTRKAQRGDEALALIEVGGLRCFSIGYSVRAGGSRMKGEVRELTDLELYEISIVTIPANPNARLAA